MRAPRHGQRHPRKVTNVFTLRLQRNQKQPGPSLSHGCRSGADRECRARTVVPFQPCRGAWLQTGLAVSWGAPQRPIVLFHIDRVSCRGWRSLAHGCSSLGSRYTAFKSIRFIDDHGGDSRSGQNSMSNIEQLKDVNGWKASLI